MTTKRAILWVVILALAGGWGHFALAQQTRAAASEYRVVTADGFSDAALTALLNKQAVEGWELVGTSYRHVDRGGTLTSAPILILRRSR